MSIINCLEEKNRTINVCNMLHRKKIFEFKKKTIYIKRKLEFELYTFLFGLYNK